MGFSGSDTNNISKQDALNFTKGCDKRYIVKKLLDVTFHGEEYQDDFKYNQFEMSYFCRAFNITSFGVSKQSNRIKNRYKKYSGNNDIEEYFVSLIDAEYPGFRSESPRMDDLLAAYRKPSESKQDSDSNNGFEPVYTQQEMRSSNTTSPSPENDEIGNIIGGIILIAIASFIISKFFKGGSSFGALNLLECLFFYGGIIALIASVVTKRIINTWKLCIASIFIGLGFGHLVDSNVLMGIVFFCIGAALMYFSKK